MIGLRLLLAAVAIATVAYIWNTLSYSIPVVTSIESAYDYIIGTFGLKYLLKMLPLHRCNIQFMLLLLLWDVMDSESDGFRIRRNPTLFRKSVGYINPIVSDSNCFFQSNSTILNNSTLIDGEICCVFFTF